MEEETNTNNETPAETTGDQLAKTLLCALAGFAAAKLINSGYDSARIAIASRKSNPTPE